MDLDAFELSLFERAWIAIRAGSKRANLRRCFLEKEGVKCADGRDVELDEDEEDEDGRENVEKEKDGELDEFCRFDAGRSDDESGGRLARDLNEKLVVAVEGNITGTAVDDDVRYTRRCDDRCG